MRLHRLLKPHVCKHGAHWWLVDADGHVAIRSETTAVGIYFYITNLAVMKKALVKIIAADKLIGYRNGE